MVVVGTQAPTGLPTQEAQITAIAGASFIAKAEFFIALMLPWMVVIIGLLVARELWLIRRRFESVHFEFVLQRLHREGKTPVIPASRGRRR